MDDPFEALISRQNCDFIDEMNIKLDSDSLTFDMQSFTNDFCQKIIKIEQKHLDYANTIINLSLKKFNNHQSRISLEDLQEINLIAFSIYKLSRKGITSENYNTKVNQYHKLTSKLFHDYGIDIILFNQMTMIHFSNPAELFKKIDLILTKSNLNAEQKRNFFIEFLKRERIPKQQDIINKIEQEKNEEYSSKLHADFNNLGKEEIEAILTKETNYPYSKKYYDFLKKYNFNVFPDELIEYYNYAQSEEFKEISKSDSEMWDNHNKIIREHNFLSYPSYKYTECEYLNELLSTDKYVPNMVKIVEIDDINI